MPERVPSPTRRALAWTSLNAVARLITQAGSVLAVSRVVGPVDYAPFALGFTLASLIASCVETGFTTALIQVPDLGPLAIRRTRLASLAVGAGLAGSFIVFGTSLARGFGQPAAAGTIQLFGAWSLLVVLAAPSRGLVLRALAFKASSLIESTTLLLGAVVVPLAVALAGDPGHALIIGQLTWALFRLVALRVVERGLTSQSSEVSGTVGIFSFGSRSSINSALTFGAENIDNLAVARRFDAVTFAGYSRSFSLFRSMVALLLQTIQAVAFPVMARSKLADEQIRRRLAAAIGLFAIISQPLLMISGSFASQVVPAMLGPEWRPAAQAARPIALAAAMYSVPVGCGPLLLARAKLGIEMTIQVLTMSALAAVLPFVTSGSVVSVGYCVAAVYGARSIAYLTFAGRSLGSARDLLVAAVPGCLFGGATLLLSDLLQRDASWMIRAIAWATTAAAGVYALTWSRRAVSAIAHLVPRTVLRLLRVSESSQAT